MTLESGVRVGFPYALGLTQVFLCLISKVEKETSDHDTPN